MVEIERAKTASGDSQNAGSRDEMRTSQDGPAQPP